MTNTYSISQLLGKIQSALDASIPEEVWVTGEITSWREPSHMAYFTLAEPNSQGQGFKATLPVVIFPRERYRIEAILRRSSGGILSLENGVNVRIKGSLNIYAPQGRLQLRMTSIDPAFTIGQLALEKARILKALGAAGLLEQNKRLPLSLLPLRIALISSHDSAAYNDVIKQFNESGFGWQVTPLNVFVQGARSERSIVQAFSYIDIDQAVFDAVILARGGGSATDLASFDAEGVARAIAACPVPVLTGIGHEIDRSVADEAAHTACKTPTACAQTLIDRVRRFDDISIQLWEAIVTNVRWLLDDHREKLLEVGRGVQRAPRQNIALARQFLASTPRRLTLATASKLTRDKTFIADIPSRLTRAAHGPLQAVRQQLAGAQHRLGTAAGNALDKQAGELVSLEARLQALDPEKIMARGWSITRQSDGSVVRSAAGVNTGDELTTQLADGEVTSSVVGTRIDELSQTSAIGRHNGSDE